MPREPDPRATLPADEDSVAPQAPSGVAAAGDALSPPALGPGAGDAQPHDVPEDGPASRRAGQVLARRYRLLERLGAGAHGEVWAVHDEVLREPAALKWIHHPSKVSLARVQRESTTLRLLRMPGVVRFIDEGVEDGHPFIVMERVSGRPFPGVLPLRPGPSGRLPWEAISGVTHSLLEVLSQVHAAGVVHRDLKPDNVLVSAEERVTLLDFGISLLSEPGSERLTGAGQTIGTPRYLAPEQLPGAAAGPRPTIDARTDLYAVGIMLYEALAGCAPHEASGATALLEARRLEPAPRIRDRAPELPRTVAEVVDRLVSRHIESRFRSAVEVIAALRGEAPAARSDAVLPWLGERRPIDAIVEAVMAGRSIDVIGPPGSGRTRCLEEVARRLSDGARRVVWTDPVRSPFAALVRLVDPLSDAPSMRLAAMAAHVEEQVRALLRNGTIVIVDDVENTDPESLAVLDRCRSGPGVVVRALPETPAGADRAEYVLLEPLDEASLRPLFAGPDRLFHLREGAARALWERTEGWPGRIEAELTLWVRRGVARRVDELFVVSRDALARLGAGLLGVLPPGLAPGSCTAVPHLVDLLRWLSLGGHPIGLRQLASAMDQPIWRIEAGCEALVRRGAARWSRRLSIAPCCQVDIPWTREQRAEAHRAIARALRPGQEGRLFHLLMADLAQESVDEAIAVSRRCVRQGNLSGAAVALEEGLRVARQHEGSAWLAREARLLAELVKAAFAEETPATKGRALYEIARAKGRGAGVEQLESLVRASMAAPGADSSRALEDLNTMEPFADLELERRRQRARIWAASAKTSSLQLEAVLRSVEEWARTGEPLAELALLEGRGVLCYVEGQYDEAAALYAQAARRDPGLAGRVLATIKSASALLESFQHEAARARAVESRTMARRCRNPYWEGRAEWIVRAALYRKGEASKPELDLVEAVALVGVDDLEALVALTEAAVALRAGELSTASMLAERSVRLYRGLDRPWGKHLARCLSIACGASLEPGELDSLPGTAMSCEVPGIGVQALGLLGRRFPEERWRWREAPQRLWESVPIEHWDKRIDVLSVEESLSAAFGRQRRLRLIRRARSSR